MPRKVFVSGCLDLLHNRHIACYKSAAEMAFIASHSPPGVGRDRRPSIAYLYGLPDDLRRLPAGRHRRHHSNLAFEEWGTTFPNRLLGAATLDRLRHTAYCVVLDGDSFRNPRYRTIPDLCRR